MQSDGLQILSDDELATSNLLHYFPAPDDLQSLTSLGPSQQKAFLNPQELIANVGFPDSPNGSLPDSSSDSTASIQRTGSAASTQTPIMTGMTDMTTTDELDDSMDWRNRHMPGSNQNDSALPFVRQDESLANLMFPSIDSDGEDAFMSQFNFPPAFSRNIDTMPSSHMNISSPSIPTTEINSSANVDLPNGHQQNNAVRECNLDNLARPGLTIFPQYSAAFVGGQAREASRELSPMSSMVASHGGSPAGTVFNIPSPSGSTWAASIIAPPNISDTLSSHRNFNAQVSHLQAALFKNDNATFSQNVNNISYFDGFRRHDTVTSINKPVTYNFTGGYELKIYPTPTKSRVETQIPIKMALNPLPPGITKLHLPPHTISKPKLMAKPAAQRSPDTLELFVSLVCTSAVEQKEAKKRALERAATNPQDYLPDLDDDENSPQRGGEVRICAGCITRERKRAARKKVKKPEEDKMWSADEHRRVVVFNTSEIKDWQPISALDNNGRPEQNRHARAMQVDAPMRIACYCRHHNEKAGFNVIFTIKDWKDNVIAQAMSNPIMITDDHKTNSTTQPAMSEPVSSSALQQSMDIDHNLGMQTQSGSPMAFSPTAVQSNNGQTVSYAPLSSNTTPSTSAAGVPGRPLSRPPSPNQGGPAKKRKSSASGRVPNGLAMTRMDISTNMSAQNNISQHVSAATSPFSPNPHTFPTPEAIFGSMSNPQVPFTNGSTTPNGTDRAPSFGNRRSESMDNVSMAQLYSAPTSSHPSRAPSPSGLRNSINSTSLSQLSGQFPQPIGRSLYAMPPASVNEQLAMPIIHKVIPNEGPKVGGIEVTVIGASFVQGHEVWFGGAKAITTTFWGPQALVCLVPPSAAAGLVPVTVGRQEALAYTQPPMFKYIDDTEDKLIRTALAVLGHKMSGRIVDVNELAHRILNNGGSGWGNAGGSTGGGSGGSGSAYHQAAPNETHLESQLLNVLDLIDLDDSPHRTQLDLKGSSGHTMLHLACSQGYHRLVAALLARGASPYVRDRGGFTPLHFAALYNHPEIARRLLLARADPTIRSLSSLTAVDVAQSRAVVRTIRSTQRHNRSRSGGSLRSTSSSAASLRSLWEPLTRAQTHEEPISVDPSEESPEYTSDDFEDEDSDDNDLLQMRRPSGIALDKGVVVLEEVAAAVVDDANNSVAAQTTALAAALKNQVQEQLQQFQQQLSQQLQNFTHLPQIPQMPQMPTFAGMQALPDYQAYLQQAPFIRRVQQMMPNMTGNRPDNQGDNEAKVDGRWWDLSSYMNGASAAPPAYADIYPEADRDRKIQSAARAALEAEADLKYSKLYGQRQQQSAVTVARESVTTIEASVVTPAGRSTEIPKILEIGRKHAITKEQQENFLRAREQKLKKISNDRNLFFIWVSHRRSLLFLLNIRNLFANQLFLP